MRRMMVRCLVACAVLAGAPAAHAHFPSSIDTTVTPGGNATITSPTLDPSMRSATVDVVPTQDFGDKVLAKLQVVMAQTPSKRDRLMVCIGMYLGFSGGLAPSPTNFADDEGPGPLLVLLTSACLRMAFGVDQARQQAPPATGTRAHSSAGSCRRSATQVPATFTKVGRLYRVHASGTTAPSNGRGGLTITCRRKGRGVSFKVRPKARGRSLRSVVGSTLKLGIFSPFDTPGSATLKVTFRR